MKEKKSKGRRRLSFGFGAAVDFRVILSQGFELIGVFGSCNHLGNYCSKFGFDFLED